MRLSCDQLSELESLAIRAAKRAGAMIQSRVRADHQILAKDGGSSLASQVVTEVDFESQRLILATLEASIERYDLGLLTEESPDDCSRHTRDHFWCIDPLDGTLAFTKQAPGYSVSIALVARDGTPRIGVVYDPVTDTTYHATDGQGARRNGQPWTVSSPASGRPLTLRIDHSFIAQASDPAFRERLDAVAERAGCHGVRIIDHTGAVLNACGVVDQAPALYFKFPKPNPGGGSLWDFAASACLFQELGLPATDIHGRPLHLNPQSSTFMNRGGVIYASDPELAMAVGDLRR